MTSQPDIREYTERNGQGLPKFAPGLVYEINGKWLRVRRVLATMSKPARVDVEVEPADAEELPR